MIPDTRMGERRNELLADLVAVAERVFQECEIPPAAAVIAANALADRLADHWGGQTISYPKDHHWKLAKLELEIYDAFDGRNYGDLARKHGIHERSVRRLIARTRAKLATGGQDGLFDPPAAA